MIFLKQHNPFTFKAGPFLATGDGVAQTGLTINQADVRLSKNGGSFAQKSDTAAGVHDEFGYYTISGASGDASTVGSLLSAISLVGSKPVQNEFAVLAQNTYDSMHGTEPLDVNTIEINGDRTDGNNAELKLKRLDVQGPAPVYVKLTGGAGAAIDVIAPLIANAFALRLTGGGGLHIEATSGYAFSAIARNTHAAHIRSDASGYALYMESSASTGVYVKSNGTALWLDAGTSGIAFLLNGTVGLKAVATDGSGLDIEGTTNGIHARGTALGSNGILGEAQNQGSGYKGIGHGTGSGAYFYSPSSYAVVYNGASGGLYSTEMITLDTNLNAVLAEVTGTSSVTTNTYNEVTGAAADTISILNEVTGTSVVTTNTYNEVTGAKALVSEMNGNQLITGGTGDIDMVTTYDYAANPLHTYRVTGGGRTRL